jgi:3-oxoacyl-[acyl-carrier protein] reductase
MNNIIVTGGAKGIGKSLVKKLLLENANVGIFDTDEQALNDIKMEFPNVYCVLCDVSDHNQVEEAVNEYYNKFNCIDVLINNAGLIYSSPLISLGKGGLVKHDIEMWNKVINTDLNSVFYVTANVVEKMIQKRTKGVIINVSSICAVGNVGQSAYSAAKSAVNALTNLWSKELASFRIRVAGIAPGFTATETTMTSINRSIINELKKKTPVRRFGEPSEIVDGIMFIINNEYYNGRTLELDGGLKL